VTRTGTELMASRRELSRVLGVALRTVGNLEADGVVKPAKRGRGGRSSMYDLTVAIPAYISHVSTAPVASEERAARARRDTAAARLNEIKVAREEGGLIDYEQVAAAGQTVVRVWRTVLLQLPHQLVVSGVIEKAQQPGVASAVRDLLTHISEWRPESAVQPPPTRRRKD
jgi:phage terminase Nu1 subunit (DNA packaging protein)